MLSPQPKPVKTRKQLKARAQRAERAVAQKVRTAVLLRDVVCRLFDTATLWPVFGKCEGWPEWAHLGAHKRFKTRGMDPKDRHQAPGTCLLCRRHHEDYDQHRIDIQPATSRGADGPLGFQIRDTVYVEAER